MNQRGFATLEVILMVMVIGILASIAVPRFTSVTTAANTAKIQADLTTIDTAISIYYMEHGEYPKNFPSDLSNYLQDSANIKPPVGKAYYKSGDTISELTITNGTNYSFKEVNSETRAVLSDHTAGEFTVQKTAKE